MRVILLSLICCAWITSCSQHQGDTVQETAISGNAEVLVDADIAALVQPSKELYDKATPNATVTLKQASALDAVRQLLQHEARGVIIARDWLPEEQAEVNADKGSEGYPRTLLAKDALVLFAAKEFPYDTMHADHIASWLATGTFARTSYPKLKRTPALVVPGSYSSVYGNLINVVLKGKTPASGVVTSVGTADSVRTFVKVNPNALGFALLSQLVNDTSVKMIRLSWTDSTGVYEHPRPVHQGYLVQGLYPFPVPIWFILRDRANNYNLPSGLMLFMARDGGAQRTFLDAGIEPAFAKIELNIQD